MMIRFRAGILGSKQNTANTKTWTDWIDNEQFKTTTGSRSGEALYGSKTRCNVLVLLVPQCSCFFTVSRAPYKTGHRSILRRRTSADLERWMFFMRTPICQDIYNRHFSGSHPIQVRRLAAVQLCSGPCRRIACRLSGQRNWRDT